MNNKNVTLKDYNQENNTLKRVVKTDNREKIELEIGDSKQKDFISQVKIMKWNNEVNFSLRYDNGSRNFTEDKGKIKCDGTEEVVMYELDEGFEFEIILKEKPKSNIFNYSIETKGLDFFYQPELTSDEKEQGFNRPENVIGSYAVYHKTKRHNNLKAKHNYKTGKFCHIYRPKAIDSKGVEIWCDLNIDVDSKNLTVTVPQDFLNKASYPVIVDPTFGYTTKGSSVGVLCETEMFTNTSTRHGSVFESSSNAGSIEKITFWAVISDGEGPYNIDTTVFINEVDSDGTDKHGEIVSKEELDLNFNGTVAYEQEMTLSTSVEIKASTDYLISAVSDSSNLRFFEGVGIMYDSGGTGYQETITSSSAYSTLKNKDPWEPIVTNTNKYSIYATYTTAPLPPAPMVTSRRSLL